MPVSPPGVWFVTRLKDNTAYMVVEARPVPTRGGILSDELIILTGPLSRTKYPADLPLRRVALRTLEGDTLVFITDHLGLGATAVAPIYQDRWQIELFFKVLRHVLMENRHGLIVDGMATTADGYAERDAALLMLQAHEATPETFEGDRSVAVAVAPVWDVRSI